MEAPTCWHSITYLHGHVVSQFHKEGLSYISLDARQSRCGLVHTLNFTCAPSNTVVDLFENKV